MSKVFQFGVNSQGVESRFVYLFMKTKKFPAKYKQQKSAKKSEIKKNKTSTGKNEKNERKRQSATSL